MEIVINRYGNVDAYRIINVLSTLHYICAFVWPYLTRFCKCINIEVLFLFRDLVILAIVNYKKCDSLSESWDKKETYFTGNQLWIV